MNSRVPEHDKFTSHPVKPESEAKLLVVGMLAAPVGWLLHLAVSFSLVETLCRTGSAWIHHAVAAAALAIALPGGWAAWKEWRSTPRDEESAPRGRHRTHFLAISGMVNSAFFGLIIVLTWAAAFVIPPCTGSP